MEQHRFIWAVNSSGLFLTKQGPSGETEAYWQDEITIHHDSSKGNLMTINVRGSVYRIPNQTELEKIFQVLRNDTNGSAIELYCSENLQKC